MQRLLVLAMALIALLAGAMVWSGAAAEKRADFSFIDRADIITLDQNQMSYMQDFRIAYTIREGLFSYRPGDLLPIPAGASSVDVTPDKKTWTFHLRPEAKWTNGDPVRTKDYLFSWRRMLEEPGEYTYLFYYLENAQAYEAAFQTDHPMSFDQVGVKALDDLTLEVKLHDPCTFFLDLIAFCPFYPRNERSMEPFKEVVKGKVTYRPEYTRPPEVVTNGSYYLKDWEFKRRLRLVKSPNYWDRDHVTLNSIDVIVNTDDLSKLLTYETGEVDWLADLAPDIAFELRRRGRTDLVVTPGFGTCFLNINTAPNVKETTFKNPLADQRVRQAFAMAIDKGIICSTIARMGERPATTYTPPGIFPGFEPRPGLAFDVAKARKLLADAGYPDGKGFPTLPLIFSNQYPIYRDMMQSIKNQLRDNLNIDTDIQGFESKVTRLRLKNKEYFLAPSQWIGDYGDPSTFTDKYLSTSENNDSSWAVPEFDHLCDLASREPDTAKRTKMLQDAEYLIDTDLPVIPMFFIVNTDLCRPNVHIPFNPRMTVNLKSLVVDR